ncbi:hypothetical protein HPB48_024308 [Haemaphysalis longicornis]|uniref:Uncharacterized protein n=1 Tax=Haemaphysalis longicornis TaxID=44386 RepID=A0A9J6H907_HAELO|nr:hypothetical protein HPB48_024308 [Haemaphysalis longicornis]
MEHSLQQRMRTSSNKFSFPSFWVAHFQTAALFFNMTGAPFTPAGIIIGNLYAPRTEGLDKYLLKIG